MKVWRKATHQLNLKIFFMSKREAIWMTALVLVVIGGFYYYMKYMFKPAHKQPAEVLVANADSMPVRLDGSREWVLPKELNEISANVFLDDNRMACIQDQDGIIYVFNLQSKKIDEKIQFAGSGDYEGLAKVENTLYVLRSDGFLFEVQLQNGSKPVVKTYDLPLELENETESLCYDNANNRLLVGVKEKDLQMNDGKGIYGFDLKTKKMSTKAVLYIESSGGAEDKKDKDKDKEMDGDKDKGDKGKGKKKKKGKSEIKPSGMGIHPKTNDLYVLDGPSSRLFITDMKGKIKNKIQLDKQTFPQPEGLCFSTSGDLYISSEADKNGQGIIAKFAPDISQ